MGVVVGALIILHVFNVIVVDLKVLALVGILFTVVALPYLRSAKLPGGTSLEFKDELSKAQEIERRVEEREPEYSEEHVPHWSEALRLFDVPDHVREMALDDPNLALAGLRIEIHRALRNATEVLWRVWNQPPIGPASPEKLLRKIAETGTFLDDEQHDLLEAILRLTKRAVEGEHVDGLAALSVFEMADTLNGSFGMGYALNFDPNPWWEEQEAVVCPYEHCIENMPYVKAHRTTDDPVQLQHWFDLGLFDYDVDVRKAVAARLDELKEGEKQPSSTPSVCPLWRHECPGGQEMVVERCPVARGEVRSYWQVAVHGIESLGLPEPAGELPERGSAEHEGAVHRHDDSGGDDVPRFGLVCPDCHARSALRSFKNVNEAAERIET